MMATSRAPLMLLLGLCLGYTVCCTALPRSIGSAASAIQDGKHLDVVQHATTIHQQELKECIKYLERHMPKVQDLNTA